MRIHYLIIVKRKRRERKGVGKAREDMVECDSHREQEEEEEEGGRQRKA